MVEVDTRTFGASAFFVAVLALGGACGTRGLGPGEGDPPETVGLHAVVDGVLSLPEPATLREIAEGGFPTLSSAGRSDTARAGLAALVRCALPAGVSLEKPDDHGTAYTFEGALGLAPQLAAAACDTGCQEILTACLLAHVNTVHALKVPIWLTSGAPQIGRATSPSYPIEEATFFGNLWAPGATAAYCKAATVTVDRVPGRLGILPGEGLNYEDSLADKYYRNADELRAGTCAACARSPSGDVEACALDGVTFTHPVTVWRSRAYQAEGATLSGDAKIAGDVDRVLHVRASWMNPGAAVTFEGVAAAKAGANTLAIYYTNGDLAGSPQRKLAIAVNGSPARVEVFPATPSGWQQAQAHLVNFDGFREGTNTITFTVPADGPGPDLDWIEVVPAL